jgi:hypothetical protein
MIKVEYSLQLCCELDNKEADAHTLISVQLRTVAVNLKIHFFLLENTWCVSLKNNTVSDIRTIICGRDILYVKKGFLFWILLQFDF